ncbi:MAG: hypothetical protein U9R19_08905 [Bacteroidota bacterium]|nr:hypothetical protein [Bacteroidota bacterium]
MNTIKYYSKKSMIAILCFAFLISGCNKDNSDSKSLSFCFKDGYIKDHGWVVLHNLSGTEVIDYKRVEKDGYVSFGKIDESSVTISYIVIEKVNGDKGQNKFIDINSYYDVPIGNWKIENYKFSKESLGTANISMTYPQSNYNEYFLSTSDNYINSTEVPTGGINHVLETHRIEDGDKYSIYGSVLNNDGGYCGWLLDQDFYSNQVNYYYLALDRPLNIADVTSSQPLHDIYLYGCRYQPYSSLRVFKKRYNELPQNEEINHKLYYPENMPVDKWMLRCFYNPEGSSCGYTKFFDKEQGLPENLIIPNNNIIATYDEYNDEITNIQINGTADNIFGRWSYYQYDDSIFIYWKVYANRDRLKISKPQLPFEVIQDIGETLNNMECDYVGIIDYNTTSNHADIINRFFISDILKDELYDESSDCLYFFNYK